MVVARSAVMVVARVKASVATTEGYRGDGGGGDEDIRKSNSGKNGERSDNSGGGASHLYLSFYFFFGRAHNKVARFVFLRYISNYHVMTQTTVRQIHVSWRTLSDNSKGDIIAMLPGTNYVCTLRRNPH